MTLIDLCERGLIPDALTRFGMRKLVQRRLADEGRDDGEARSRRYSEFIGELRASPIAVETKTANQQHYEVPAEFFHRHLGPRLKYSCCLYPTGNETLARAEELMLELYAERAGLADGMRVLDLGCGWGSLSLWLAEKYPASKIVGLSNSRGQREFILRRAAERSLHNLTVVTGNIVDFQFPPGFDARFDRVISIEMFEHMKNYGLLLKKISGWMKPDAKLFVHIFAHRFFAYHFEAKDPSDWMSRYFFTGGTMPSENLLLNFQDDLKIETQWWISGTHYEKTANQWLAGMDAHKAEIMRVFRDGYGQAHAAVWFNRWRMFYMAVAELFGYTGGEEWGVGHYLLVPRRT
jgi:cyclopropane-fatty-acyl-phospholipid synthase